MDNLTSAADRIAIGYGFDRRGVGCNCEWSSKWHGDICPEHGGGPGTPIRSEREARGERIVALEAEVERLTAERDAADIAANHDCRNGHDHDRSEPAQLLADARGWSGHLAPGDIGSVVLGVEARDDLADVINRLIGEVERLTARVAPPDGPEDDRLESARVADARGISCSPANSEGTPPMTDADLCRLNDWPPGTVLEGREEWPDGGWGESRIVLTAVGERSVLARQVARRSHRDPAWKAVDARESGWALDCRDWRAVGVAGEADTCCTNAAGGCRYSWTPDKGEDAAR